MTLKVLVLWANSNQPNIGVRALSEGASMLVRKAWPYADVRHHGTGPGGDGDNDGPMNIGHIPPILREYVQRKRGLREWLTSFDLILDTRAGDSFTDIYGRERLLKMSAIPALARLWGVPFILGPQTIGPFEYVSSRILARFILSQSSGIMVRDQVSAVAATQLGHAPDLVATDVVFALDRPETIPARDAILNVSGLLWNPNPHVDYMAYRSLMQGLVASLESAARKVSLLAHTVPVTGSEVGGDIGAARELKQSLGRNLEVLIPDSLDEARTMLGSGRLTIAARMHACLNSISMGVPSIPLAYSRKFNALFQDLGWPHTLDLRDPKISCARILREASDPLLQANVSTVLSNADGKIESAVKYLRSHASGWGLTEDSADD